MNIATHLKAGEKTCKKCGKEKSKKNFEITSTGYARGICSTCRLKRKIELNPGYYSEQKKKNRQKHPAAYIVRDSQKSDKKRGREGNDLTREFVKDLISNSCSYCGETNIRMTVDRINNDLAHLQKNVVVACIRCNLMRGSMPYEIWMVLVPHIKKMREQGLFGDWVK
jgi:hypothetical protein